MMEYNNKDARVYSRFRLYVPIIDFKNPQKRNNLKIIKIVCIITIAIVTSIFIINSINPIVDKLCINEAQNIATRISNEQSSYIMQNYNYNDLMTITRDNDNNISMIQANTNNINKIISDIPIKIIDEIKDNSNSNIYIYFGSLLGLKIFSR